MFKYISNKQLVISLAAVVVIMALLVVTIVFFIGRTSGDAETQPTLSGEGGAPPLATVNGQEDVDDTPQPKGYGENGLHNGIINGGNEYDELPMYEEEVLPQTARLAFVGDIMMHMPQMDAARLAPGEYDFNYAFRYVAPYIQMADFAIGNLETTLVHSGYRGWPMFRSPRALATALVNAGFDMVTTGNNHSFDAFADGVRSTIEILTEEGLAFTGTYLTRECRDIITLVEVNGFTFAMINYTMHMNGLNMGEYYFMARIIYHDLIEQSQIDYEMIAESIAMARALNPDFVVVLPHIGIEYYGTGRRQWGPYGHQWDTFDRTDTRWFNWMRTIHFFLESGADIVMSHHPHTLLPAEFVYITEADGTIRRTFVAYSMANFISGQRTLPRETSAIFYLDFARDENGVAYISGAYHVPVWVRMRNPLRPGEYCFTVLPVTSTLRRVAEGDRADLRDVDIDRIRQVQLEVTHMLSGMPIPVEEKQDIYEITRYRNITQFPGLPLWGTLPWY